MKENKKFFWIKLKSDFWNDPYIKLLRRMAGGDTYTIIYLKLLTISAKDNGYIYFQGAGADLAEELSLILDENVEDLRALLAYLHAKKLITVSNDTNDIFLVASADVTGSETDSAKRMREFRERQTKSLSQSNANSSHCDTAVTTSYDKLEKEKELEKELEIEKDIKHIGKAEPTDTPKVPYKEIVDYLNQKTRANFKSTARANQALIKARFNEGYSLDDFKKVIDNKVDAWLNDNEMSKYLRPATLFGNKFDSYLNEKHKPLTAKEKDWGY